jgi:predicted RNase H-like HicB family nuclease
MKVLHVSVEQDDGWFIAQGLEEPGVITQGRTLDEIVANVREVIELMFERKDVDIELLLSSRLALARRGRGAGKGRGPRGAVNRKAKRAQAA